MHEFRVEPAIPYTIYYSFQILKVALDMGFSPLKVTWQKATQRGFLRTGDKKDEKGNNGQHF